MAPKITSSRAARSRRYYERHRKEILAKRKARRAEINAYQRGRIKDIQAWVNALKERTPCTDCQRSFPSFVMDFDHVRGTKVSGIARLIANKVSLQTVKAEIAKCEIVCSNCHRIRTHT